MTAIDIMVITVVMVMIIIVVMIVMVIIVIMVLLVFMVIMVIRTDRKTRTTGTNGADRTETRDMTFKLDFLCDLCKAANLAMFNAGMIFCLCCIDVMLVIMNCVTCEV